MAVNFCGLDVYNKRYKSVKSGKLVGIGEKSTNV